MRDRGPAAQGQAALLLILSALGYAHLRRVSPTAEVFPHLTDRVPARTA